MVDLTLGFPPHDKKASLGLPVPVVPHRITLAVRKVDGRLAQPATVNKPEGVAQASELRYFWQPRFTARAMAALRRPQVLAEDREGGSGLLAQP